MPRNPIIPYDPKLRKYARDLRKNPTRAERVLWSHIRRKRLGVEFHRQVPIDRYIVDFYCHELKLAIEVDGITHNSERAVARDRKRQKELESLGITVLRFYDHDVLEHLEAVLQAIILWIQRLSLAD